MKKVMAVVTALFASLVIFLLVFATWGIVPNVAPEAVTKQTHSGATLVVALRSAIERELDHAWLPNDIGRQHLCWNYRDFQFGELDVWRRVTYQLREHLSRVRTTDAIDANLDAANSAINNNPRKFWLPSFESKARESIASLDAYVATLPEKQNFSARADNLRYLIDDLASMMGNTQNRLAQALPTRMEIPSAETEGDTSADEPAPHVSGGGVGFWESSRIFFNAKGQAYATLIALEAIRIEFNDVLAKKNSLALVDDAIFWLNDAIKLRPLMVMHSNRDGLFANHLDNFAAPFGQARSKLNSLGDVLKNG